ncbi:MAG: competence/damage-inducible protein A [Chloroflexi bacterium]|nr:competence/damage-inducible protein A [Chloroflexota bacterium]
MKAEIISVGTEILLGDILDTNTQYIASRLPGLGIDLYYTSTVGDNLGRLTEAVRRAFERSDLTIMTGGLGPTEDDLTREAIAAALDEELYVDQAVADRLRAFFTARGLPFPERNVKQATLIASARALPNPRGTAPGWWVEREGRVIVAMPGPPAEMERMWNEEVAPELAKRSTGAVIVSRTLKTIGLGEGHVDEMVSPLLKSANPTIGVYAKMDGVHLRLTAKAATAAEARRLIEPLEAEVRRILGEAIWGADDDTLEGAVGRMLKERGLTLATMESCTGGLLADTITNVAGASDYFKGGYVAYLPETKASLGVGAELIEAHGVVSAEVAAGMARAARERADADIGIGVTGVAGPDPLEGKPPGTMHIAVDDGVSPQTISYTYYQGRLATKRRAVTTALALLRRLLLARG